MIPQSRHLFFPVSKVITAGCADELLILIYAILRIIEVHHLIHALTPVSLAAPSHFKSYDSHQPCAYGAAGLEVELFEMIVFYRLFSVNKF